MDELGSSTFPQQFGYDDQEVVREEGNQDFQDDFLQLKSKSARVFIMGLRRSGKTSITKVIFNKMSPNETLFLESTNRISKGIWNFPGQMDSFDQNFSDDTFTGVSKGALVFVIDAQDEYTEALNTLINVIQRVYKLNQNILFEVFIHKIDCVSDENKFEIQKDIFSHDLIDIDLEFIKISYHLTSIYDHSIYEAFSKVCSKLLDNLASLENLLNVFISTCKIEKAYLFDVLSKIYIATDGSPVDMQSYELCCEMIDVVIDISNLYSVKETGEPNPFDKNSASIIKLNNQTVLYLREVNNYLALVCILREDCFDRQGVIDYNFQCFKDAINEIFSKPPESTPVKLTD